MYERVGGGRGGRGEGREETTELPKAGGEERRKKRVERNGIRLLSDQEWPLSPLFLILAG